MRTSTVALLVASALVTLPAGAALILYSITRDPSLRPLGITFSSLLAAGQIENDGKITAVVSINPQSAQSFSQSQHAEQLRIAFDRYQTDIQIRYRDIPQGYPSSVTFLVGESRIGPYELARAASGVAPAAQAERMVKAHALQQLKKEEQKQANDSSLLDWFRVFD